MTSAAVDAVEALRLAGETVATAESLTGGLLCAALVDVPGASDVVRGGVVAYASEVKVDVLGVGVEILREQGTVNPVVAARMALGAVEQLNATWGVSTTGVAGPDPSEGKPVGTVHVAIATAHEATTYDFVFVGDRRSIREQTVCAALSALVARLREESASNGG